MKRTSRTFRLTLSPAGMDLLIDSHCRLIRTTRCLLAWGTTLHVAIAHLDTVAPDGVIDALTQLPALGLTGSQVYFLGAPATLNDIAARIARQAGEHAPERAPPELRHIYLVALQRMMMADSDVLRAVYASLGR